MFIQVQLVLASWITSPELEQNRIITGQYINIHVTVHIFNIHLRYI